MYLSFFSNCEEIKLSKDPAMDIKTIDYDTGGRLNWCKDNIFSEIRLFVCIFFAVHEEP